MGTLLNALRRIQRQVPAASTAAEPTSVIVVNSQTKPEVTSTRALKMDGSREPRSAVPMNQHRGDRVRGRSQEAGLDQGAWDARIDATLASVDALLAKAMTVGPEMASTPSPPDRPPPSGGGFGDRIRQIAPDGTIGPTIAPRDVVHPSANWQLTLEMLDEELQCLDCPDTIESIELACDPDDDDDEEEICPHSADALIHAGEVDAPIRRDCHSSGRNPSSDAQFHQALDYAARVMSDTRHLTVDLLHSDGKSSNRETVEPSNDPVEIDESDDDDMADSLALDDDSSDDALGMDPGGFGETNCDTSSCDAKDACPSHDATRRAPLTDGRVPADVPREPAIARPSATAFEEGLAAKIANTRYYHQCHTVMSRILDDLTNSPFGRTVVVVGCDGQCDASEVIAALGHLFTQLFAARVLLVDAHATDPSLSRHYEAQGVPGLSEACESIEQWQRSVKPTHHEQIFLLPSGCRLDRGLLSEDILQELLAKIRSEFDLIIVDAGEAMSDRAAPWLVRGDAAYLVVQLGVTDRGQAKRTMASLKNRKRFLRGCVVMAPGADTGVDTGQKALN